MGPASPFLIVTNAVESANFYRDQLGFEVRLITPQDAPFFAIVGYGEAQILLKQVEPHVGPLPNRLRHEWAPWDVFIHLDNPERYASELVDRGTELLRPVHLRDDGLRGIEVEDADGYVLFFGVPEAYDR